VFRIASIALRLCGALALILGLVFWSGNALGLIPIHMLLGILVVLSLWVTGIGQALSSGGIWPIAAAAVLLGLLLLVVGMTQSSLMPGSFHWVIQVIHLLLGVLAVGLGQISAARARNGAALREERPSRAA
jgi:hypothetical protein